MSSPPVHTAASLAGFRFSEVLIVQALEAPYDVLTGDMLCGYINSLKDDAPLKLAARVINVDSANEFGDLVRGLSRNAQEGLLPLLHVECHGDKEEGLEFPNGSRLSWSDLSASLVDLNRASRFNLLAVFSACYGGHFLRQLEAVEPAPCWCMVAPTETVSASEIMAATRGFYRALYHGLDVGLAIKAVRARKMDRGDWLAMPAELWFKQLVAGYLEKFCTESAVDSRVQAQRLSLSKDGVDVGIGRLKRRMRHANRTMVLSTYFDRYFMIDSVPENAARFRAAKEDVARYMNELRARGTYVL